MASDQVCPSCVLLLILTGLPGVLCEDDYTLGALVGAAGVAFIFLAVVIAMIVVGFTWNSWYPKMQQAKGRVKMPREYWKKKEEAKLRLLNGGSSTMGRRTSPSENGLPNGAPPSRVQDTGPKREDNRSDTASWIQGWTNATLVEDKGYEEMGLAMDLGEEGDDQEYRIETVVVDNETLDLGPFKDDDVTTANGQGPAATSTGVRTSSQTAAGAGTSSQTATLEMTEERGDDDDDDVGLYSTVDKSRPTSTKSDAVAGDAVPSTEAVTSFSKLDPYLVAF